MSSWISNGVWAHEVDLYGTMFGILRRNVLFVVLSNGLIHNLRNRWVFRQYGIVFFWELPVFCAFIGRFTALYAAYFTCVPPCSNERVKGMCGDTPLCCTTIVPTQQCWCFVLSNGRSLVGGRCWVQIGIALFLSFCNLTKRCDQKNCSMRFSFIHAFMGTTLQRGADFFKRVRNGSYGRIKTIFRCARYSAIKASPPKCVKQHNIQETV